MDRYDSDNYYHGGLGSENRRDWDRSSRDGDFGRDYENRFRSSRGRNDEEYRRRDHNMEQNYYNNTQGSGPELSNIRQGYGIAGFGSEGRYTDTGEDIAQRMRRDREKLQQQGYGSGRMSGYSGSAFGGSNYSSHGDFGGSSGYGAMSGGGGNVDDYVSMSGYGGGRGSISTRSDRGVPDYSSSRFGDQYSDGLGSGMGSSRYGSQNYSRDNDYSSRSRYNSYSPDNYGSTKGNYKADRSTDRGWGNSDRGGYENYDPNNRWNY